MSASLVGSEMCIRDSQERVEIRTQTAARRKGEGRKGGFEPPRRDGPVPVAAGETCDPGVWIGGFESNTVSRIIKET
eukprot:8025451-Alexandrium_andersonii.AAC.1